MPLLNTKARRLIVLGSTGSIGVNTLEVVKHLDEAGAARIDVVGLAAGRRADLLIEQAKACRAGSLAIADESSAARIRRELAGTKVFAGSDAACRLIEASDATDICAAMVGSVGLPATLCAIEKGLTVSLANKETLVAAGALVTPLVQKYGATLIPIDSEHSAIFQCLHGQPPDAVRRIVLTASGGPFRTADRKAMDSATVEQALNHPTWNMGRKITIDSATMMNKALEIVEAHWLFNLPGKKISVLIHPQSIVHSFVEFMDHSVLAQLGPPDMKTPIQYALTYPDRLAGCSEALDWSTLQRLDFEEPDLHKFPALKLAYQVVEAGGTAGAVFNAANEAAVAAFLEHRIRFGRIVELVAEALNGIETGPGHNLETVLDADRRARAFVRNRINKKSGKCSRFTVQSR